MMTLLPASATYKSNDGVEHEGAAGERNSDGDGESEGDKLASAGEADALAPVLREEVRLGEALPDGEGEPGGADEAAVGVSDALADADAVGEGEGETDASCAVPLHLVMTRRPRLPGTKTRPDLSAAIACGIK